MKFTVERFRKWKHKRITLLGMSGVGKTELSERLRKNDWFHYSGDYRIGRRYLDEDIRDLVVSEAMKLPLLRELFRKDWIGIHNNMRVDDLGPVLSYVGKLGNPEKGGIELEEFMRRQARYREAEIAAMRDVPVFIRKAEEIYGYEHFVNDVGGSLCEMEDPGLMELLAQHTLLLYIQVTNNEEEQKLIERAQMSPKPLYYRPEFLVEYFNRYLEEHNLQYAAEMDPDDFTSWIFPHLFRSRIPRYEAIAEQGYSVTSEEIAAVRDTQDFLNLLEQAVAQKGEE